MKYDVRNEEIRRVVEVLSENWEVYEFFLEKRRTDLETLKKNTELPEEKLLESVESLKEAGLVEDWKHDPENPLHLTSFGNYLMRLMKKAHYFYSK
ncbi:MAG: hypothetical protein DRP11_01560 [Candidatus Aenigmatarchaeota archaeon]|nr:MAG: hypothetical protein DRP11_01560 [Candidatus Aenigmarchaeota archaeon]